MVEDPDVEALAADAAARARALDCSRSFIVQAPAGSGKTGLLIQRYLALLASADAPEQILAITFTRKAAAQLRQRLLDAMRQVAQPPPAADFARRTWELANAAVERDRQQGWHLLQRTERLRVQTIDSFCQSLVRRYPLLARLPGAAQPVEDADELYREACTALLTHLDAAGPVREALSALLLHVDNDWAYLRGVLLDMLARREQWLGPLLTADQDALERGLRCCVADELAQLHRAFAGPQLQTLVTVAAALAKTPAGRAIRAPLAAVLRVPGADADSLPIWQALACWLTTQSTQTWFKRLGKSQGFDADSKAEKAQVEAALAVLREVPGLDHRLAATQALPAARYSDEQWRMIEALRVVLPLAVAELQWVFERCGQVDFTELQLAAQRVLGTVDEPSELALHLDYRLSHVLVDEFQDTSVAQATLLETLTGGWTPGDGRTLFLVGDPMQSIYRFRQAEVALFLDAQQGRFGQVPLTPLRLRRNFRSAAGLVAWVNRAFRQALPVQADSTCAAVPYAAAVAARPDEPGAATLPVVHHYACEVAPTEDADPEAVMALEAQRIGEQVQRHLDDGAQSIAILVRSRGQLPAITEALLRAGVRVSATDIHPVADHPALLDLRAMTIAVTDRYDRIAWLALLRAPWSGLSLPDLTRLVENAQGELDAATPLWTLLNDAEVIARLSDDGQRRLHRVRAVMAQALPHYGRMPLTALVHWLWQALGAAALCDRRSHRIAELFFQTLNAQESGYALPSRFRLDRALARIHELPDPQADGRVHVMTLHKSKGLEFDVVVLPDLARQPRRGAAALLNWTDYRDAAGRSHLLLAPGRARSGEPDPIYTLIQRLEGRREDFESARLLYVGCTRARHHLHLFCHVRRRRDGTPAPHGAQGLARHVWSTEAAAFASQRQAATGPLSSAPAPVLTQRVAAAWAPPVVPPMLSAPSPDGRKTRRPDYDWAGDVARHVGTVIHRWLQAIAEQGLAHWDERRLLHRQASIRAQLRGLGVTAAGLDDAQRRVVRALCHAVTDPQGRWVLSDHRDAHCEWPLSGLEAGQWVQRIIDRSFVDEAGQRWIIDYKTGAHEGGDLATFLREERQRYTEQLQTYRRLLLTLEDRPVRMALYFPMVPAFLELA